MNLCLAGACVMTYIRDERGGKVRPAGLAARYEVPLPRRALQVQTGTVRYDYMHSIPNGGLLDDRRVSITFRQNVLPEHNC